MECLGYMLRSYYCMHHPFACLSEVSGLAPVRLAVRVPHMSQSTGSASSGTRLAQLAPFQKVTELELCLLPSMPALHSRLPSKGVLKAQGFSSLPPSRRSLNWNCRHPRAICKKWFCSDCHQCLGLKQGVPLQKAIQLEA